MSSIRISRLANQLNSISSHLSALQSRPSSRIATSNLDCFSLSPYRHQPFIQHRSFTLTRLKLKEPPSDGIKSTYPSSDEPERGNAHTDAQAHNPRGDRGHLSFTKASLFKLTLPLHSDSSNSTPSSPLQIQSTPTAERAHSVVFLLHGGQPLSYIASLIRAEAPSPEPGARQTQSNENYSTSTSSDSSIASTDSEGGFSESNESTFVDSSEPSAQSAPSPESPPAPAPTPKYEPNSVSKKEINQGAKQTWENQAYADETKDREDEERDFKRSSSPALGTPPITFHTKSGDGKRWSPSTGIGDFLRDAARAGSFVISVGNRAILVSVPSFEDRTRFLRSSLYAKTSQIETLAKLKGECDSIAHKSSRRLAFAGLGILGTWWITCCYLTFFTELGWDTLEPVSYLVGLGTLGAGYTWFLAHNRDISYRAVLSESTSRRQQQLYIDRGFNVELYMDLIDEVKDLRKTIKKIATEYGDQQWDQGDTRSGQENKRALEIIRNREAQESGPTSSSKDEDEEEGEEGSDGEKKKSSNPSKRKGGEDDSTGKGSKEMELDQRDNDGDGIPDGKQKKQRGGK